MATKRDVEFGISASVAGVESITQLKDEVQKLAKQGGEAAPEFQKLAEQLDRLGDQARALDTFDEIAQDIAKLGTEASEAGAKTNSLKQEFDQITVTANEFRRSQADAATALRTSQEALVDTKLELARYKAENRDAIGDTDAYKTKVRELGVAIVELRTEIAEQSRTLRDVKEVTKEAEAAESKALATYKESSKASDALSRSLRERETAQREALNSLAALGVETADLTQAERALVGALNASEAERQRLTRIEREAAEDRARQAREDERLAAIQMNTMLELRAAAQAQRDAELRDYAQMEVAQKSAAESARQSAGAIRDAFGTVGVKSVAELKAEIEKVRSSLEFLRTSGNLSGRELDQAMGVGARRVKELELQIREATGAMTLMDRATNIFRTSFGQTFGAFVASNVLMRIVDGVTQMGASFIKANKDLESFRLALGTVYKDAGVAEKQLDFLRKTAANSGQSVGDLSQSFVKFSASMQTANIPIGQTNALFEALAQTAGTLGLSADQTQRAIDALGQIAAKGTVSMEELRQQLGDALPGALSIAANGLGLTEQQLIKLVESGNLAARDFLPAFTKGLQAVSGEVNTFQAKINELKNTFAVFFQAIGDSGVWDVFKLGLSGITAIAQNTFVALMALVEGFTFVGRAAGVAAAAIASGKSPLEAIAAEAERMNTRLAKMVSNYDQSGDAAKRNAEATSGLNGQIVQLGVKYSELEKSAQNNVTLAKAQAATQDELSKITTEAANAFGSEAEKLAAASQAAAQKAANTKTLAEAEAGEVRLLQDKLAAKLVLFEQEARELAQGELTAEQLAKIAEGRGKEINDLIEQIKLKQEVAAKSEAQARSAGIAAEAARLEALANQDNSGRVKELRDAYESASAELKRLTDLKTLGNATDGQVAAATTKVREAKALLNDALRDEMELLKATTASKVADQQLVIAGLEAEQQRYASLEATARAIGDENLATYAKIEAKKLEIQIVKANTQIAIIEAEGKREVAKATLEELKSSGELTAAKRIELETQIKLAEAQVIAAKTRGQSVEVIEREIEALRTGTSSKVANAAAANNAAGSIGDEAASRQRNANAIESETEALTRQIRAKKSGEVTGSMNQVPDGFSSVDELDNWWAQQQQARRESNIAGESTWAKFTWDSAEAEYKATRSALASKGSSSTSGSSAASSSSLSRSDNSFYQNQLKQAVARGDAADAAEIRDILGGNLSSTASAAPTPVNITINGIRQSLNVASAADAATLQGILEQLANGKARI